MDDHAPGLSDRALRELRGYKGTLTKRHATFGAGGLPRRNLAKPVPTITLRRADYEREKGARS